MTLVVDATTTAIRGSKSAACAGGRYLGAVTGAGTGLIGLIERVTLADGELEHGVDPDGAFVLRACLPR